MAKHRLRKVENGGSADQLERLHTENEHLIEAQVALERSRDDYRQLFDWAPLPMLILDGGYRMTRANYAAAELFGVQLSDLEFHPFWPLLEREDWLATQQHLLLAPTTKVERCRVRFVPEGKPAFNAELAIRYMRGSAPRSQEAQ